MDYLCIPVFVSTVGACSGQLIGLVTFEPSQHVNCCAGHFERSSTLVTLSQHVYKLPVVVELVQHVQAATLVIVCPGGQLAQPQIPVDSIDCGDTQV